MINLTKITLLFAIIFSVSFSYGADENLFNGVTLESFNPTDQIIVQDAWYLQYQSNTDEDYFTTEYSNAKVKLWFDDSERKFYAPSWNLDVTYSIRLTKEDGTDVEFIDEELSIDFDQNGAYKDINLKIYQDDIYIKAEIWNITFESDELSLSEEDIHFDLELNARRYYLLDTDEIAENVHHTGTNTLENGYQTEVIWDYVEGAESYDLEWLFIDNPAEDLADLLELEGTYSFKNATRVNLLTHNYKINLAYPKGLILFRVRPVGKKVIDDKVVRIEGKWSLETIISDTDPELTSIAEVPLTQKLAFEGLLSTTNWQYQAGFAEEGKRGEVLSIYDGGLKPRQTLSTNNSDSTIILSQTVYDYLGRPSISLLPTPEANNGIGFYSGRLEQGIDDYYDYQDFDIRVMVGEVESANRIDNPNAMSGLGVNDYYSSTGDEIGLHDNLVADAQNYPFARTTFTKDGTGRVRTQTAVGGSVIGSSALSGAATKLTHYLYGTPTQEELYRLFGNEVGFASHYKKNAIIDQNGQAHIQYLDMSGRVIATCLAGDAPENLIEIDSYPEEFDQITADLTENNTFNEDGELIISKRIIVPYATEYEFNYSLDDISYWDDCLLSEFGVGVKYDLLIYIEDENYAPFNLGVLPFNEDASGDTYYREGITESDIISFNLLLPFGEYTINKVLRINEVAIESVREIYLGSQDCFDWDPTTGTPCNETCEELCSSGYSFINEAGNRVYFNETGDLVAEEVDIDSYTYYGAFTWSDLTEILDEINTCIEKCDDKPIFTVDGCEQKWQLMLHDMSPGGQYFDNTPFGELEPLVGGRNAWLIDEFGPTPIGVHVELPPFTSWDELRDNWEEEYAEYLIHGHPEYCIHGLHCGLGLNSSGDCIIKLQGASPGPEDDKCYPDCPGDFIGLSPADYNYLMNTTTAAYGTDLEYLFNPTNIPNSELYATEAQRAAYQFADPLMVDEQYDPYVNCRSVLQAGLNTRLLQFLDVTGTGVYHTIWYVLDDPENIHLGGGVYSDPVRNYYISLHGNGIDIDGIIGTGDGQITKYQYFKGVYMTFRANVEYELIETLELTEGGACSGTISRLESPTEDNFTAEGFLIHYPERNGLDPFDPDLTEEDFEAEVDEACETVCEAAAESWMIELGDCASPSVLDDAKALMIEICKGSCDEDNPYGGDDSGILEFTGTIGANSYTVSTFEEVIDAVNIEEGLVDGCDYVSHPPENPADFMTDCECTNITNFITVFYASIGEPLPVMDATFSLSGLSADDLDDLISSLEETMSDEEIADGDIITQSQIENWVIDCYNDDPLVNLIDAFVCGDLPEFDIMDFEDDCSEFLDAIENHYNELQFELELAEGWLDFLAGYTEKAWENIASRELFTMAYDLHEYHYTLFYYDQAGNLIKTVPPAGIYRKPNGGGIIENWQKSTLTATEIQDCKNHVSDPDTYEYLHPEHELITNYKYNSLQQLIEQTTPDGGTTSYWYDALGRLIVSQNARQFAETDNIYSYTIYDELGRVTQAGEISKIGIGTEMTETIATDPLLYKDWLTTGTKKEVIRTIYGAYAESTDEIRTELGVDTDNPTDALSIRGRIGSVIYQSDYDNDIALFDHAIHYRYDYAGNVKTVVQENRLLYDQLVSDPAQDELKYVRTDYTYDLISGNVIQVDYQDHLRDQYHHRYEYDENNRLTVSYSSRDGEIWQKEAKNFYYAHGPLARQEIGDQIVQASDYVYTINGWLKTANSSVNDENALGILNDVGKDGQAGQINENSGRDAFGFSLHYYEDDYVAVDPTATENLLVDFAGGGEFSSTAHDLYNGNIHQMITSVNNTDENPMDVLANKYRYDQLQRIKSSKVFQGVNIRDNNSMIGSGTLGDAYATNYTFDGNGNILSLNRNNASGDQMDQLEYHYNFHIDLDDDGPDESITTHQLKYVDDGGGSGFSATDIEDQDAGNYAYDAIGQLTRDEANDIREIQWTVTGKVKKIIYDNSLNPDIETNTVYIVFAYDPMGIRVSKEVLSIINVPPVGSPGDPDYEPGYATYDLETTYYMHDASGNVLATYDRKFSPVGGTEYVNLNEHYLYGSKRLGTDNQLIDMNNPIDYVESDYKQRVLGEKSYELSNHLGNVLAVVSDRKLVSSIDGSNVDYYEADVTSYAEYYPYGMVLRSGSDGGNYRYGFQGQEDDPEIKGEGNSTNYKYRMHDPRIGRFFAVDPLTAEYPHYAPYSFSGNKVIAFIELEGLEEKNAITAVIITTYDASIAITTVIGVSGDIAYHMPEATLDGLVYFGTQMDNTGECLMSSLNLMFSNSSEESKTQFIETMNNWAEEEALGYSYEGGFEWGESIAADPSLENLLRYIGGATTLAGSGSTISFVNSSGKILLRNLVKKSIDITRRSIDDKLYRYVLNPDHPVGGIKAKWFKEALGFTRENADDLAKQIVFDEAKATVKKTTEHGTIYNQTINITGANGNKIDVVFGFIKNADNEVKMTTAIPTKKK